MNVQTIANIIRESIIVIKYLGIAAGLITCVYAIIASFNPKSMWYDGDKIVGGWEKEEAKKAKAEVERRKRKKWFEW